MKHSPNVMSVNIQFKILPSTPLRQIQFMKQPQMSQTEFTQKADNGEKMLGSSIKVGGFSQ